VVMVKPSITPPTSIVVVKKPYTNPARQPVTLRAESPFTGTGTLNRSNDSVHFFTSAVGGTEITFDGTDNVFTAAQLTAGHPIYTEGVRPSAALDDVQLTLTLTVNGQRGLSATAKRTSVELTLDICMSRTAAGVDPPLISNNDKINIGRFVQVRDPAHNHERAMLIVRQAQPAVFAEDLVLTPINAKVQLFADEVPATGQIPLITPHNIPDSATLANGARFFVQGIGVSTAVRDTGFQLGIRDVENDGDRVAITVVQIEITENSTANAPAVTFTRFGLWDNAYDAAGNVRNGVAEAANFVGADTRKYHFRLRDPAGAGEVQVNWKTLNADRTTDDDAPVSQALTLLETAPGSKVFVSRAVTLVTDNTDRDFPTNSGLNPPHPDAGLRQSGQSNHRTRRAKIDGFVRGEYSPQAGVRLPVILPVFDRDPDERKRLNVRVIRYTDASFVAATDGYIAQQFRHANDRWNQVGIQIDSQATVDRQIPAGALTGSEYAGSLDNANEQAALNDLIPITPDNTVTAVFVPLSGANAYATTFQRTTVVLGDRYFIFIDEDLDLTDETLAHELHHVLFNRGDTATDDQFFTFNTTPPGDLVAGTGIVLPHVRIYRRVQNMNSPDPNNDPNNDNVINWARRQRTARFPIAPGISPATATTGNRLVQNF
jgi:hypothetical protein